LLACVWLFACKDGSKTEKVGQVVVSEVEYSVRKTHGSSGTGNSFVIDAHGKIKNIGDVDVKKVVVTGYCRSCTLAFTSQKWFTSDCDKMANQVDIISYLSVGAEENFSFEEIAFYITHETVQPENMPEDIEVVIEFDVVE
jgi:hypothetical protein